MVQERDYRFSIQYRRRSLSTLLLAGTAAFPQRIARYSRSSLRAKYFNPLISPLAARAYGYLSLILGFERGSRQFHSISRKPLMGCDSGSQLGKRAIAFSEQGDDGGRCDFILWFVPANGRCIPPFFERLAYNVEFD